MKRSLFKYIFGTIICLVIFTNACKKDEEIINIGPNKFPKATPYDLKLPNSLASLPTFIPRDNPLTVEGVKLGRFLFYDSLLSADNTISCGSCHEQKDAFSNSPMQFSKGITGQFGKKNSMNLFNLIFQKGPLFWDGREPTLEDQIIQPVIDPVEMANTWEKVIERIKRRQEYIDLYQVAFQTEIITKENLAKSIAQFLRTIISGNAPIDKGITGDALKGKFLFFEAPQFDDKSGFRTSGGFDCGHCHTVPLFQPENKLPDFMNNDMGGVFRVPSLRNVTVTAPYMHDGSLTNLDSVIKHYEFAKNNPGVDINMWRMTHASNLSNPAKARLNITAIELKQLKAFLSTLKDDSLTVKKEYSNPFRK